MVSIRGDQRLDNHLASYSEEFEFYSKNKTGTHFKTISTRTT